MAVKINSKGRSHLNALVNSGKVNKTSKWSFSTDDRDKILGDPPNWDEYEKWFLGIDTDKSKDTKARYKYPFGKFGNVYRSALIAIRQRSAQQDETEIYNVAGKAIDRIDAKENKAMPDNIEKRFVPFEDTEIRVVREDDKPAKLVGYFAKFNKLSDNLGGFREKIERGFFADALKSSDTVDLFNHDANYVLGRMSSGTLKMKEDDTGLRFECNPPDTQLIRDMVLTPIERGDIKGCSFGFRLKGDGDMWEEDDNGVVIRTLKKKGCRELVDGSQVTFPAYPDTDVAVRSMDKWEEERNIENKENGEMEKPDWYVPKEDRKKGDMSRETINSMIWDAVYEKFSDGFEPNDDRAYVQDTFETYLIFRKGNKCYKVDWSIMDDEVRFGETIKEVERVWQEVELERSDYKPDMSKRIAIKEKQLIMETI